MFCTGQNWFKLEQLEDHHFDTLDRNPVLSELREDSSPFSYAVE